MPKKIVKTSKKAVPSKKAPVNPSKKETVVAAPVPVILPSTPVKSEADKIWDEIKNLSIQMFGLPDQIVAHHCTPIPVEPNRLFITMRSTAALPSLEAAIAPLFQVELADKFVIITRAPKPFSPSKKK